MSDRSTPETDAVAEAVGMGHFMVDAEFARRLERERDEAREALRTLAEHGESEIQRVTKERDEARAALRVIADCQNWFHTDKEEGGPYTAWRGDGQPDEIAEKALEEAK